jgi:hypothetical protein
VTAMKKKRIMKTMSGNDDVLIALMVFFPVFTNLAILLISYPFGFSF